MPRDKKGFVDTIKDAIKLATDTAPAVLTPREAKRARKLERLRLQAQRRSEKRAARVANAA